MLDHVGVRTALSSLKFVQDGGLQRLAAGQLWLCSPESILMLDALLVLECITEHPRYRFCGGHLEILTLAKLLDCMMCSL